MGTVAKRKVMAATGQGEKESNALMVIKIEEETLLIIAH